MTPIRSAEERQPEVKKKRVVLGELKNLSNVSVSFNKAKPNTKKSAVLTRKIELDCNENKDVDFDSKSDDTQMCGFYVSEVYAYLHKLETDQKKRPLPDYIEKVQKDVSPNMRGVLVDWLVEVAEEYKLVSDTLYMTVSYNDRFLSVKAISRQKLQLLGVSAMLIASKYEEISPPDVEDFCYITDNTYTKDEVVKMESDVLNSLKFELGSPALITFGGKKMKELSPVFYHHEGL